MEYVEGQTLRDRTQPFTLKQVVEIGIQVAEGLAAAHEKGIVHRDIKTENLMLRKDVVEAAAAGKFHLYPVRTIDQGAEILTGVPAGEKTQGGTYAPGTINYLVDQKLLELAQKMKAFEGEGEKKNV